MNIKLRQLLFYLLIASLLATGISFSRFSAILTNTGAESVEPGTEPGIEFSTWVLEHGLVEVGEQFTLQNMLPGDSKTIKIRIMNWKEDGEEVKISDYSQRVDLELETTGNLPLKYVLRENGGNDLFARCYDSYCYCLREKLAFAAGEEQTREFTLTITWPEESRDEFYKYEIDYIQLKLAAVQAQPDYPDYPEQPDEPDEPDQ